MTIILQHIVTTKFLSLNLNPSIDPINSTTAFPSHTLQPYPDRFMAVWLHFLSLGHSDWLLSRDAGIRLFCEHSGLSAQEQKLLDSVQNTTPSFQMFLLL